MLQQSHCSYFTSFLIQTTLRGRGVCSRISHSRIFKGFLSHKTPILYHFSAKHGLPKTSIERVWDSSDPYSHGGRITGEARFHFLQKPKPAPYRRQSSENVTVTFPRFLVPEALRPSESRMFSKETSFHAAGQPEKNFGSPLTSCTISSIIAVTDAHMPSICIISSPGASPATVNLPELVPRPMMESPWLYTSWREP